MNFLQLFSAAAVVLRRIGEDSRIIQEFIDLGAKAKVAATEAMDTEAALGEIPDEFLDPIQVRFPILLDCIMMILVINLDRISNVLLNVQYTLMKDPVILPSSRITVDLPVIQRHLLSDSVCLRSILYCSIWYIENLVPELCS